MRGILESGIKEVQTVVGIVYYLDKEGKEKTAGIQGMRYDETIEEYLDRRGIEYEKVINWNEED